MEKRIEILTGVCPNIVQFDVEDGKIHNLQFNKGCHGNGQFISRLVEGQEITKIVELAEGIRCGNKSTSCGDQLAKVLKAKL